MSTAEWEEKRILFDEKMGRAWPKADLSARAKFMREYVLRQFWQSFVEDKFDRESAIPTKAEFSYAIIVMDKIGGWEEGKMGRIWIRSKCVEFHENSDVQWATQHAELHALQILIFCGSSELVVRRCS